MGKSHLHRSGFLDLRRDGADSAEIHLQAIVVEPMQSGGVLWLEAHEKFAGDIPRRPHTEQILPVDKPEEAAVDRDLGNIPPGIGKTRFWPFRTGGNGPGGQNPLAGKIQDEDQRAGRDREAAEKRPNPRKTREKRLGSVLIWSIIPNFTETRAIG